MNKSERYQRNIQVPCFAEEGQTKLLNAKILVAGAGGLGSGVIANLCGLGAGTIGIIDADTLEITNFNRQFIHKIADIGSAKTSSALEYARNYNPDIEVKTYNLELNTENHKEIAQEYDILIDCFDSYKSKFLMNRIALEMNKPLIHAGVTETGGQVTTIIPYKTACLDCILGNTSEAQDNYISKGVLSPAVCTLASIQAFEAAKLITGTGELLTDRLLVFDGLKMTFKELKIAKNHRCSLCGK